MEAERIKEKKNVTHAERQETNTNWGEEWDRKSANWDLKTGAEGLINGKSFLCDKWGAGEKNDLAWEMKDEGARGGGGGGGPG